MPSLRHPLRERVLLQVRNGRFASVREIMTVASVPRQTVNRWLREAGLSLAAARLQFVAKLRDIEAHHLQNRPPAKRPSKAAIRQSGERAKVQWDRDHGAGG